MTSTAIRFDEVRRRFGANEALAGFTARVPEGSVTALLGRNGAGKSTALKCALGLLRPDAGRIEILGRGSDRLDPATLAHIGYVSERQQLDPRFRVDELLELTRAFHEEAGIWDEVLADDLLVRLELPAGARVGDLSQGQSRKLSLLLNLAHRPRLLVLDEPAANLDAVVRREFLETLLAQLRRDGLTVLLSTHQLQDVERVADRVVFIEAGRCRLESDLDALKERVKAVRLVPANGQAVPDLSPPHLLRSRRLGKEVELVLDHFEPEVRARLEAESGARAEVLDLPLEEIFIALGQHSAPPGAATTRRTS